jgi:hypothetical protein
LIALGVGWDIVVVQADGTDRRRLTDDPETEWDPTWSPDGTRLAYWLDDPVPPGDTCGACGISAPRRLVVAEVRKDAALALDDVEEAHRRDLPDRRMPVAGVAAHLLRDARPSE